MQLWRSHHIQRLLSQSGWQGQQPPTSHSSGGWVCNRAAGTVRSLVKSSSWFTHSHLLRSHMVERESYGPFISLRASALTMSSKPNYLPKVSSPDPSRWGLGCRHMILRRRTQPFSPEQMWSSEKSKLMNTAFSMTR